MPEVYRAAPQPQLRRHECDYPGTYDPYRPVGSIWKCSGCGKYWYKYTMRGLSFISAPRNWERVRWYHRRYWRIIKGLQ